MYSPSHRKDGAPVINIQSTLRIATDLCKNISLAVFFGSNGISHTISTQSDMRVCVSVCECVCAQTHTHTHILHNIQTLVGRKK